MSDALDSMLNVIPVAVTAGVVMKVTDSMFGGAQQRYNSQAPVRQRSVRSRRPVGRRQYKNLSGLNFNNSWGGNFSNIGY